jgi:hypothetical protein
MMRKLHYTCIMLLLLLRELRSELRNKLSSLRHLNVCLGVDLLGETNGHSSRGLPITVDLEDLCGHIDGLWLGILNRNGDSSLNWRLSRSLRDHRLDKRYPSSLRHTMVDVNLCMDWWLPSHLRTHQSLE